MRILVINDLVSGGGTENVMQLLLSHLSSDIDNQIELFTTIGQKEAFQKLDLKNIRYSHGFSQELGRQKRFSVPWFFYRLLYAFEGFPLVFKRFDLVLVLKEGPTMIMGTKMRAKKKIAWVQVDYSLLHWTKNCFESLKQEVNCMQQYDHVVCVSQAAKDAVCSVIGDPGNLIVKLNPMNVQQIFQKSELKNIELEDYLQARTKNRPILVSMGRLAEEKGYFRLFDCCEKLNREFDYELWVLGDGPLKQQLEEQRIAQKLDNVVMWGNQENPYPFIKKADWMVSASFGESYGLAVQESILLGVPALVTTCPAFEECLSSREAILVPNTEEALYEGLYGLLSHYEQYRQQYSQAVKREEKIQQMYGDRIKEIEKLWKKNESEQ